MLKIKVRNINYFMLGGVVIIALQAADTHEEQNKIASVQQLLRLKPESVVQVHDGLITCMHYLKNKRAELDEKDEDARPHGPNEFLMLAGSKHFFSLTRDPKFTGDACKILQLKDYCQKYNLELVNAVSTSGDVWLGMQYSVQDTEPIGAMDGLKSCALLASNAGLVALVQKQGEDFMISEKLTKKSIGALCFCDDKILVGYVDGDKGIDVCELDQNGEPVLSSESAYELRHDALRHKGLYYNLIALKQLCGSQQNTSNSIYAGYICDTDQHPMDAGCKKGAIAKWDQPKSYPSFIRHFKARIACLETDETHLYAGMDTKGIYVLDNDLQKIMLIKYSSENYCMNALAIKGTLLCAGHEDGITCWDKKTGQPVAMLVTDEEVNCLASGQNELFAGTEKGMVIKDSLTRVLEHQKKLKHEHGIDETIQ